MHTPNESTRPPTFSRFKCESALMAAADCVARDQPFCSPLPGAHCQTSQVRSSRHTHALTTETRWRYGGRTVVRFPITLLKGIREHTTQLASRQPPKASRSHNTAFVACYGNARCIASHPSYRDALHPSLKKTDKSPPLSGENLQNE